MREPVVRSAIRALQLPAGSQGLDAGCGIGLQTGLLAEAVGSAGHVTGLDLFPEFLIYAGKIMAESGLSKWTAFSAGNVTDLPFGDGVFDWAWSMDCIGYLPLEPVPLLRELIRVLRPGGKVAILAWSSEKLLPGFPLLEARLNATTSGIAPFIAGGKPDSHFQRALAWFRAAGLDELAVQTFAGEVFAPLTADLRGAMEALIHMRWQGVKDELTHEDWEEYQRLCLPVSEDYILNRPDYYAFFTYSMFSGIVRS